MITSTIPAWMIDLTKLEPIDDRIVIERVEVPETGLLVIPDMARKPVHRGRVVRVGPGKFFGDGTRRPMQVKPGDMVRYQSADVDAGSHVLIEEADVLFIEECDHKWDYDKVCRTCGYDDSPDYRD